jgi:transitional endoplasmic reticulum ATPase
MQCAPSIIIIDEIEALATNREDLKFDAITRNIVINAMLLLDKISHIPEVVLIGTTNKPETIDSAFRAPHRFGKEIRFFSPKTNEREEIINLIIQKSPILDRKLIDTKKVAEEANGFTGADLNMLFQEAFINHLKEIGFYEQFISTPLKFSDIRDKLRISTQNFLNVFKARIIRPALLRSYLVETPKVSFTDVGGLNEAKKILEENIKFPQLYPDLFIKFNARRTHGILLYGPPGCGKTLLAKALANESNMNFIYIKAAEVLNRWLGESEAAVREIFSKAKAAAPCIIFFDELDAISSIRGIDGNVHSDRVTAQILTEIDGLEDLKNVICIGATNRLDIIDPAIMRPGRLYPIIKIDIPSDKEREEIFKIHIRNKPIDNDVNLKELAQLTTGMGGATIEEIVHEATLITIRENVNCLKSIGDQNPPSKIAKRFFTKAIEEIKNKTKNAMDPQTQKLYC